MRRLVRTGGTKDADIRELRSQIAKMTKENDELRTRVVLAATSYRNIAEGVALLDQEIGDLQKQNEEFRKRIQWLHHKSRRNNFALKEKRTQIPELQSQVLQKNQNLARARQEAAAKNALVASLRNQVNTLSRLSLLPTEIQSP
jgi:chromosome segregation ATPase